MGDEVVGRFHYQIEVERFHRETLLTERYANPKRILAAGRKVYSQNDEDGLMAEIFNRIKTTTRTFVEFGVEDGLESNSTFLVLQGWKGFWIEGNAQHLPGINQRFAQPIGRGDLRVKEAFINAENIDGVIEEGTRGLLSDGDLDLLSIDIDRNDYFVWEAIRCVKPRVVVIEYNASIPPPVSVTVAYEPTKIWDGSNCFGASLSALEKLGTDKGYRLVGCNFTGVNAFFVREDLVGDHFLEPFTAENHYEPPRYYLNFFAGHPPGFGQFETI